MKTRSIFLLLVMLALTALSVTHSQDNLYSGFLDSNSDLDKWWSLNQKQFEKSLSFFKRDPLAKSEPVENEFKVNKLELEKATKGLQLKTEMQCAVYLELYKDITRDLLMQSTDKLERELLTVVMERLEKNYPSYGGTVPSGQTFMDAFVRKISERAGLNSEGKDMEPLIKEGFHQSVHKSVMMRLAQLELERAFRAGKSKERLAKEKALRSRKDPSMPTPQQTTSAIKLITFVKFYHPDNIDFLLANKLAEPFKAPLVKSGDPKEQEKTDKNRADLIGKALTLLVHMGPMAIPVIEEALDEYIDDYQSSMDFFKEPNLLIRENIADPNDDKKPERIVVNRNFRALMEQALADLKAQYKPKK